MRPPSSVMEMSSLARSLPKRFVIWSISTRIGGYSQQRMCGYYTTNRQRLQRKNAQIQSIRILPGLIEVESDLYPADRLFVLMIVLILGGNNGLDVILSPLP